MWSDRPRPILIPRGLPLPQSPWLPLPWLPLPRRPVVDHSGISVWHPSVVGRICCLDRCIIDDRGRARARHFAGPQLRGAARQPRDRAMTIVTATPRPPPRRPRSRRPGLRLRRQHAPRPALRPCALTRAAARILRDSTGTIAPALRPLAAALAARPNPAATLAWLSTPHIGVLLADLADGRIPLTHQAVAARPDWRSSIYLRDLLVDCGLLPASRISSDDNLTLTVSTRLCVSCRVSGWY
jgi:hypothetical protein